MKFGKCVPFLVATGLTLVAGCGNNDDTPTVESIIANTNLVTEEPAVVEEAPTNIVINLAELEAENQAKVDRAIESAKALLQEDKLAQATRALQEVAQLRMTPEQLDQVKTIQEEIQKAMLAKVTISGPGSEEISNLLQRAASGEQ